jgi:hypothetical protein
MFGKSSEKLAIAFVLANLCLVSALGICSDRAIAGEPDSTAMDLGEPLEMNCQIATSTLQEFFFVKQDGQQVAVDCKTIAVPAGQNASAGGYQPIQPDQSPHFQFNEPEPPSDRLRLFQTRL